MRGDKTAIDQLTIEPNWLGGGPPVELASFDRKPFAQLCPCPAGYSIRWLWLDWREPHATTIHIERDAAIEYIRLWVSGLDIDPGDLEDCDPDSKEHRSLCDVEVIAFAQPAGAIAMPYVYKPRGKRNTSSQPHPVALMSAYRYKSMMRALAAQTRAKREIKAADGIEQSSVRASIA